VTPDQSDQLDREPENYKDEQTKLVIALPGRRVR
jgi:hypothetical protein